MEKKKFLSIKKCKILWTSVIVSPITNYIALSSSKMSAIWGLANQVFFWVSELGTMGFFGHGRQWKFGRNKELCKNCTLDHAKIDGLTDEKNVDKYNF